MTPGQLKARLAALELGIEEFAALYGCSPRTAQRMKAGKNDIPRDMEQWFDEYEKARR